MRDIVEIYMHWQGGRKVSQIARSLGIDRKTVRKYIEKAQQAGMDANLPRTQEEWAEFVVRHFPETADTKARSEWFGRLDEHVDFIRDQLTTNHVSTVWQRLVEKTALEVSLSTFRRYVVFTMPELRHKPVTVWRPEVEPGDEAQVDFGYLGPWKEPGSGASRRVWAFIMVLSFSRHMFVQPVFRLDAATWLACHVAAFAFLDAVPQRVVLDNLKGGVLKADIYDPQFNRAYEQMAAHYGVLIDPCRAGRPKDKPRVERQVPYVRDSFWAGRTFLSEQQMRLEAARWCREVAGMRIHGTTRKRPLEVYEATEKPLMRPLPAEPWELAVWTTAKVSSDCHAAVKGALYSIPFAHREKTLNVRLTDERVEFYDQSELVKVHRRLERGRQTDPLDLPEDKRAFFERTPRWCLRQAQMMGESVVEACHLLLETKTLAHLRQAQGILRLADAYGAKRLEAACRRALDFGDARYRTVKNILEKGLDTRETSTAPDRSREVGAHLRGRDAFALNHPATPKE